MLTITRRPGEVVVIDHGTVIITFGDMIEGRCVVSIEAPPVVSIKRGELLDDENVRKRVLSLISPDPSNPLTEVRVPVVRKLYNNRKRARRGKKRAQTQPEQAA